MDAASDSMQISYRLNVSGSAPARAARLPELAGAAVYQPSMLDRMGDQVRRSTPLLAASGLAGGVIGAKLLHMTGGGIFRGLVGAIAGVLAGASIGMAGLSLLRGDNEHDAPAGLLDAPVASTSVAERERVRVMTYNVHGGMGGPGEFGASDADLDALAAVIRREQPDVLLLQEVDRFASRSTYSNVLAQLDERLGADSAVSGTAQTTVFGRDQDVAVLTFNGFTIADARNIVHPDPKGAGAGVRLPAFLDLAKKTVGGALGKEWGGDATNAVRNTIETLVRTPGGSHVRVMSGHYQWPTEGIDHQARQIGTLAGALDAWNGPTIWGADFNVRGGSPFGESEQKLMATAGLTDTFDGAPPSHRPSMPQRTSTPGETPGPQGGIDRIYASDHARVIDAHVVRESGTASDHFPVVAELELMPDGVGTAISN